MAVRKHMETEKKNKGYTLIELVIVVAIFTILLAIILTGGKSAARPMCSRISRRKSLRPT